MNTRHDMYTIGIYFASVRKQLEKYDYNKKSENVSSE